MTQLSKAAEDRLTLTANLVERMYHEAHKIAAHGGAEPAEIAALTMAMATIWGHNAAPAHPE
jgi:hypothetical protein